MASVQSWVSRHKLATVAGLWASAIGVSLAVASRRVAPVKPSLNVIHARIHAQALTLAVLGGAATLHYLDLNNVLADDGGEVISSMDAFENLGDWF